MMAQIDLKWATVSFRICMLQGIGDQLMRDERQAERRLHGQYNFLGVHRNVRSGSAHVSSACFCTKEAEHMAELNVAHCVRMVKMTIYDAHRYDAFARFSEVLPHRFILDLARLQVKKRRKQLKTVHDAMLDLAHKQRLLLHKPLQSSRHAIQ